GLGIGANTAVFSVVNAVLLRPLQYKNPERIVSLATHRISGARSGLDEQVSVPDFEDWRNQSTSFEAMAFYSGGESAVLRGSTPEYAQVARVSPEFFRAFAIDPAIGRVSGDADTGLTISYAYWQKRFGGDPEVLGKTVRVLGQVRPVTAVMPPGF